MLTEKICPQCESKKDISCFVTVYGFQNSRGKYCKSCFNENEIRDVIEALEGRTFCLYCGKYIEKLHDYDKKGNSIKVYIHSDHMDAVSLGGENCVINLVNCCVECNLKKGNKPFVEWLDSLPEKYKDISRQVYIDKHVRAPEEFDPEEVELFFNKVWRSSDGKCPLSIGHRKRSVALCEAYRDPSVSYEDLDDTELAGQVMCIYFPYMDFCEDVDLLL